MTDNSNEQPKASDATLSESLSALVDDQASDLELRRLLKQEDPELNARWARYQMIGSLMRGEPVARETSLLAGIQAQLTDEPALKSTKGGFWTGAGRLAIAASVAGAIVVGAQQNLQQQLGLGGADEQLAQEAPVLSQPSLVQQPVMAVGLNAQRSPQQAMVNRNPRLIFVPAQQEASSDRTRLNNEDIQRRLNTLMLEHAQNAATNSGRGVLPYARIPKIDNIKE